MKTSYSEIVNVNYIGKKENPISLNDILIKAREENLSPASKNQQRVLVLAIDVQQDFMDDGALGVPGANEDVKRMTQFIYDNMDKISKIVTSIDTHIPHQIFHPCWWIDKDGNHPAPGTMITLADLDAGKYSAVINPTWSREYVEHLERDAKKTLTIWPYHCIQGTSGCALENQFSNMVYFHSVAKKTVTMRMVKGTDPNSEMYGIYRPEHDKKGFVDTDALNLLQNYDMIIVMGEAKSHCVLESIKQLLEYYASKPEVTKKVYILEDCMSSVVVPGVDFEAMAQKEFEYFKNKYHVNIVKSTDLVL